MSSRGFFGEGMLTAKGLDLLRNFVLALLKGYLVLAIRLFRICLRLCTLLLEQAEFLQQCHHAV